MKQKIRNIIRLGIKELRGLRHEPLLLLLIACSFSVTLYIGAKAAPDGIRHAAVAVADYDRSPLSQRITDAFLAPMFAPVKFLEQPEIDPAMDRGKYTFIVVIPAGFQQRTLDRSNPEIQLIVDATRMSQAFTGSGYISRIIAEETDKFVRLQNPEKPLYTARTVIRCRYNPNLTRSWEGAVRELAGNVTMLALILAGASMIRERERGTLEHLLVMPVTPFEIMSSKIWSMTLVVLLAAGLSLLCVIRGLLGIPVSGSFGLFLAGVLLNLFAVTSLGILLACLSRDMPQLGILLILVLLPMQILSGGTTPQSSMPPVIQAVAQFFPTTHFMRFSKAVLFRDAGLETVWPEFLKMSAIGILCFFLALRRFRKMAAG